jgi:hypothetical protein
MARKKQLLQLIADLRAETGRTQNVAVGVDEVENLKILLQRTQETLYDSHDWSFLNISRSISLANGQRYYDFPSDLNHDRIHKVSLRRNRVYSHMERGIGPAEMNAYDSNADERSDPAMRWDIRDTGSSEQMEIWPIPSSDTDQVWLWGTKDLSPLVEESDRADLDDRLIVLFAAAELLARQKSSDAEGKLALARQRLMDLQANDSKPSEMIAVGGQSPCSTYYDAATKVIVSS